MTQRQTTNDSLHDQGYVIVLDVNWSSRTKNFKSEISAWSVLSNVLKFSKYLRLGVLINEVLIKKKCITRNLASLLFGTNADAKECNTLFFFYKHLVYKHAQPQILGKFKHIAKHAPGWDFPFEKNYWWFSKNMPILIHFWLEFHKKQIETLVEFEIIYNISLSVHSRFW